jgi:hypothetical protein
MDSDPETLAFRIHDLYRKIAPQFGHEPGTTNEVRPWDELPGRDRMCAVAVADLLIQTWAEADDPEPPAEPERRMWRIKRDGDSWWNSPYWVIDPGGKPDNGHWWLWTAKRALTRARKNCNPSVVWIEPDRP